MGANALITSDIAKRAASLVMQQPPSTASTVVEQPPLSPVQARCADKAQVRSMLKDVGHAAPEPTGDANADDIALFVALMDFAMAEGLQDQPPEVLCEALVAASEEGTGIPTWVYIAGGAAVLGTAAFFVLKR
jgi:hypothetical protein